MELILFRVLYFFLFFGVASIVGMLVPFLQYKGYNPMEIGTLISLYTVSGMIGQFFVGYLCDKFSTIKKIFFPSVIIMMITNTTAVIFNQKIIFYSSFLVMGFFYYIVVNLSDSWVMENEESIKSKFGPLRAFGSIGWAIGVLVSGFIIAKFGYYTVNIMYIVTVTIALIVSFKLKDTRKECKGKINFKPLLVNKEYLLTIIILLIICIAFRSYCQLIPYAIESMGGTTSNLGIFNCISSISEIVMLVWCSKIMHKFSPDKLLILSPLAILSQALILYFIPNINVIYLSGIFQICTYPIILMVGRIMIDRISPDNLKTSSQLIGFAIFNSSATIIGSMGMGFFIEKLDVKGANLVLIGITIIGVISAIFYDKKIKDKTL
ncbi:MAG: MFS transporter [Romboutsia sp.]